MATAIVCQSDHITKQEELIQLHAQPMNTGECADCGSWSWLWSNVPGRPRAMMLCQDCALGIDEE
jgi:hypothetical protein